jgi:hypothetical protein
MRCDVPRIERTGEDLAHLTHDRHLHSASLRKAQDGRDGGETLRRLVHLFDHVVEAVALAEQAARRIVAAQ